MNDGLYEKNIEMNNEFDFVLKIKMIIKFNEMKYDIGIEFDWYQTRYLSWIQLKR